MGKKNPVQSMSPDPDTGSDDEKSSSIMKDLAGPAAITGASAAYAYGVANQREERNKKFREARESRRGAIDNQMKHGMKSGGVVKSSASRRADGCAQRGKTRGKIV